MPIASYDYNDPRPNEIRARDNIINKLAAHRIGEDLRDEDGQPIPVEVAYDEYGNVQPTG